VPPERIEEVAHHYEAIGGRSPFNAWTEQQRLALEQRLVALGTPLPLRAAMWHVPPFCETVLRELTQQGVNRVLVLIMAAFHDRTTVQRYTAVVEEALQALGQDLQVSYVAGPQQHTGFYRANAQHIAEVRQQLPAAVRDRAQLLFTAHSVPTAVGRSSGYVEYFEQAARAIAHELGGVPYRCVYQSRSGAPRDPWLEPDVCDALREEAARGTPAVVLAPIGFVCDHVEVLYDLDVSAAALARELQLPLVRAATVGTHPDYIDALAQNVRQQLLSAPRAV
jgi:ferrochelatase